MRTPLKKSIEESFDTDATVIVAGNRKNNMNNQ